MSEKIEVILVDSGSSTTKSAEVIAGEIVNRKKWNSAEELLSKYPEQSFIVSSVQKNLSELRRIFRKESDIILDHTSKIPIQLDYETPQTLGPDRIALAVGANHLFPNQDNLIIDVGTCVTFDVIDQNRIFRGGTISPGLTMRMKAMAEMTKSLPDISGEWRTIKSQKYGKTTKESLLNGSFGGLINEINGMIEIVKKDFASINIILTGGDANYFDSRIKAHIFVGSKIVEIGLYRIWKNQ